ncbi:MAG: SDR family NAD(P)-dependent oxidoreductase [Bacteroidota bacterium]|nr:SDR family NAD(P)-dependent oxidoreductase [Bacteroidota bacterium]
MENRFQDQVAIITGGADGLGKAIALRLANEGAQVALFDRNADMLEKTKKEFEALNINTFTFTADISNEESVKNGFEEVQKKYRKIDIMVNSAGIVGPTNTKITDYPIDEYEKIFNVNLKGAFLVTKYAVKAMEKKGYGRILLIASIAGKEGNPGMVGYSSMKSGVIGLVKGVAKEYATQGITVNGLAPAVIKTAMNENTAPEQLAYMTAKIPMGRLGTVDEVAAMSAFIVSKENSFSTGFIYDISGGRATY